MPMLYSLSVVLSPGDFPKGPSLQGSCSVVAWSRKKLVRSAETTVDLRIAMPCRNGTTKARGPLSVDSFPFLLFSTRMLISKNFSFAKKPLLQVFTFSTSLYFYYAFVFYLDEFVSKSIVVVHWFSTGWRGAWALSRRTEMQREPGGKRVWKVTFLYTKKFYKFKKGFDETQLLGSNK